MERVKARIGTTERQWYHWRNIEDLLFNRWRTTFWFRMLFLLMIRINKIVNSILLKTKKSVIIFGRCLIFPRVQTAHMKVQLLQFLLVHWILILFLCSYLPIFISVLLLILKTEAVFSTTLMFINALPFCLSISKNASGHTIFLCLTMNYSSLPRLWYLSLQKWIHGGSF